MYDIKQQEAPFTALVVLYYPREAATDWEYRETDLR